MSTERFSVPGYNIYDGDGNILYDGDLIKKWWGGGNDGNRYRLLCIHRLKVSKRGKLTISGCENIIRSKELLKINPRTDKDFLRFGVDVEFKEYY